jgi:uncharacterized protein
MKFLSVFKVFLFIVVGFTNLKSYAIEIPEKPKTLVNDYANLLTKEQRNQLEAKLVAFDDSTSNQIALAIFETLDGDEPNMFAAELAEAWGVGDAKKDNGVLVMVAVKDKTFTIQVGYGLEGAITDLEAMRTREQEIVPRFRAGNYYEGLDAATTRLMLLAVGEYKDARPKNEKMPKGLIIIIIIAIIFIIMLISRKNGGNNGGRKRDSWDAFSRGYGPFFGAPRGGGGFGGFGGGGGGFGGFGGGGFGGGGSSGSW